MSKSLEHLLRLARSGKRGTSSPAERRARDIVRCLVDNVIGLDGEATEGIGELIALVQS